MPIVQAITIQWEKAIATAMLALCLLAAAIISAPPAGAVCQRYYSQFDNFHHHDGSPEGDRCDGDSTHSQPNYGEDFYMAGGNDTSFGFGGHDNMRMDVGADTANGGDYSDDLHLRDGGDFGEGGAANDDIFGGWGADTLEGNSGNDNMDDTASNSELEKDTLNGACAGDDTMNTKDGDPSDSINYSDGDSVFRDNDTTVGTDGIYRHTC